MGPIILPKKTNNETILVVDDEPEHIEWLIDYIDNNKLHTLVANNVAEAIEAVNEFKFLGYIVDLNIPMGGWQSVFPAPSPTYDKYMGFYVLKYVRTQGNDGKKVMAYSAHNNEQISSEIRTLYCQYIAKGRVKEFKFGVKGILGLPLDAKP